ncbi:MAG: class I SAM-dependent methyltransferase [Flavobacteriales bacterium]|nr:class I SAM-dependent methyltransferase [Flavobacteriales bacterium]
MTKESTLAADFFDSVSDRYKEKYGEKSAFHHYFFNQRLQKTLEGLDLTNKDILDIGSGTGDLYDEVVLRWPTARFYATDISAGMLAQSNVPSDQKFIGHGYESHFGTKKFDLITMLGVSTYMDDLELHKNLKFIAKSLEPNGQVIVSFTNAHALDLWLRNLAKPFLGLTGKKNKVMTSGVPIYPRSAAKAKEAMARYFSSNELHLLNQTVFPFSRVLPRPAVVLAKWIDTVPGNSAWKRWLSSDLLIKSKMIS